ncbi:MAG TPA: DUF3048 domain-containing protein [Acidimicrobiales bacterium]|nr:DUF3048 domain-containing protein [Acidimicrobiales bacterium]
MTTTPGFRVLLGRHRFVVLGVAAVLVVVAAVTAAVLVGDGGDDTTTSPGTTASSTPPPPVAPLTGVAGDFGDRLGRPALFVKLDNVEAARPQAGLGQADIVIEERVEGNLTRLAAVFHSTDADPVGPVRSVRTTDLELVGLFGRPLFASSGGNATVLDQLAEADVVDIGHNVSGEGFDRDRARPAPHNLFTSTPALYGKAPELPPPPAPLFAYRDEGEPLPAGAAPADGVELSFGGAAVSSFAWDAASGTWLRSERGTPHVDPDGVQLAPVNVVVLEIEYDTTGQLDRSTPHGIVTGTGRAVVLTQGHAIEGTWARPTLDDPLTLPGADGQPIELAPGQTFVELPPAGGAALL